MTCCLVYLFVIVRSVLFTVQKSDRRSFFNAFTICLKHDLRMDDCVLRNTTAFFLWSLVRASQIHSDTV